MLCRAERLMRKHLLKWSVVLSFVLVAAGSHESADLLGARCGQAIAAFAAAIGSVPGQGEPPWVVVEGSPGAEPSAEVADGLPGGPSGQAAGSPRALRRPSVDSVSPLRASSASVARGAPRGLRVAAERVLRLANAGVRPTGIPVDSGKSHPAGLVLYGVGGLGIGLRDGDILVEAAGAPANDSGAVISRIIEARGARVAAISGKVWRGGHVFPIVVEQPYL